MNINLEYNSEREELIIPEYGRNVQKMVKYAKSIEDKEQRQMFIEMVVNLMAQMQPQGRNGAREFKEKLWNHVFLISDYDLDVEAPDGIQIVPLKERKHPPKLPYPKEERAFRHYGHNVKELLAKAATVEDPEKQEMFINIIGSYMKLAFKTWNKEHYVNDELIRGDLQAMSAGQINIPNDLSLDYLYQASSSPKKPMKRSSTGSKSQNRGKKRKK